MRYLKHSQHLLAVATLSLFGCSTNCTGSGTSRSTVDTATYFRHQNDPSVFRVDGNTYCLVVDEKQMEAFGGFGKVRVVAPSVNFMRGKTAVAGLRCTDP
jgi:hypothetical protein